MKKIVFSLIIIFLFFIGLDKAVKYYDILQAKKSAPKEGVAPSKFLTTQQAADYKKATELNLYPYVMFAMRPGFKSPAINVNSEGFRGPEAGPKIEGVTRVVVVGGSGALGYGSTSDEKTFSHILSKLLNDNGAGKKYEVINAALPAAIAAQEFIWISQKVIPLKPDVVIIFDGFNDMVGFSSVNRPLGHPFKYSELEKAFLSKPSSTKMFIRKRLLNYRPAKKIIAFLERKRGLERKKAACYAVNEKAVEYYRETLDRISHLLKSYGIKSVFVFQPSLFFKKYTGETESRAMAEFSDKDNAVFKGMLSLGRDAMKEACAKNGDLFIDASDIFTNRKDDIFFDQVHFGDEGQRITANFIFDRLKNELP